MPGVYRAIRRKSGRYVLAAFRIEDDHLFARPDERAKLGHVDISQRARVVEPGEAVTLDDVPARRGPGVAHASIVAQRSGDPERLGSA
jgi:hypothetical protein